MSADACGPSGCGDCTLTCAGGAADTSGTGEELAVTAAGGIVVAVLAGVLALRAVPWVTTLAGLTAGAGIALAGAALIGRSSRRAGLGDAIGGTAVRLLPFVTAALVGTVLARAVTALV